MNQVLGFHNPNEEYGEFSNWYMSDFYIGGEKYNCVEQYMMERKAAMFGDTEIRSAIMRSSDPAEMKKLGRSVVGFDEHEWGMKKNSIVLDALLAKFYQNIPLSHLLQSTRGNILAECSVNDTVWGIGLKMGDKNIQNIMKWKGENRLGFLLMTVREALLAGRHPIITGAY